VLSDIAAHREVAGDAAWFAAATDPDEFAASITGLLADADLRRALTLRGMTRARAFSWRETARRTLRVYERTASGTMR
jgi:glycosyltransferase involved in cell wall biosynthesis